VVRASHSLGIDAIVKGVPGVFAVIIEKDTELPARGSDEFGMFEDYQETASIRVYEGEEKEAAKNHFLAEVVVEGIPPKPKGVEQVEVTFEYAVDNTLDVTAKVVSTSKEVKATIESPSRLLPAQKKEMVLKVKQDFKEEG